MRLSETAVIISLDIDCLLSMLQTFIVINLISKAVLAIVHHVSLAHVDLTLDVSRIATTLPLLL